MKILPCFFLFLLPNFLMAQGEPTELTCDSAVWVMPVKPIVFYVGVENFIVLKTANFDLSGIGVEVTSGSIKMASPDKYVYLADKPTGLGELRIYADNLLASTYKYIVQRMPDPLALLGAKYPGGKISVPDFQAQVGLSLTLKNIDADARFKLETYTLTHVDTAGVRTVLQGTSPFFDKDPQIFALVQKLQPGELVMFTEVVCSLVNEGTKRKLNTLAFIME